MAYEADKVVVELIAKTEALDAPVKQSATQFSGQMDKITASATKAEAAIASMSSRSAAAIRRDFGQASTAMTAFGRDMVTAGDLLKSTNSPFVVPVREGPKVASAMRLVSTGASVMGGVLASAATGGVALLAFWLVDLVSKLKSSNSELDEAVKKLKEHYEQTRLNEQAQRIFDGTVEGSIAKIRALTDELAKQNLTLEDNINLKKAAIAVALQNVQANIGGVSGDLAKAVAELKQAQRDLNDISSGKAGLFGDEQAAALQGAQAAFDKAQAKVKDLTTQLNGLNGASNAASKALKSVDFPLIEQRAKDAVDPIAAINHHFDQLASNARAAGTYTQAFANDLERQRKAALDAAKANDKLSKSTSEFGRQVSFADAAAIARAAGLTVTSAQRSTADQARLFNDPQVNRPGNPVARPGTSAHEGVNGKWALDIAFAPGLTPGKIKKVFGDQGVSLSAVFKEKGHFHIEGSRSQAAQAERAEQRAIEEERRRSEAFRQEKASAEDSEIQARAALADSAQEIANFEALQVITASNQYRANVDAAEAAGKLLPEEAQKLRDINDEREKFRLMLVQKRLREAQFADQEANFQRGRDFQSASYAAEAELLQSQQGLARTAGERKAIEDRLIDLQFEEERLKNQYIIDWAARVQANADATDKEKADAALAAQIAGLHQSTIDAREANAHGQNAQQNASPLQSYFNSIPQTAQEIDAAFEQIAANGLQTFNDALASAIVNFTSLRDVARTVLQQLATDLIKFALQQIELHTLGQLLATSSIASTTALAAAAGAAWAGPAALASLATVGTNAGPAAAALGSTFSLAMALGATPKAKGGPIDGPGGPTDDRVLIAASPGEYMIRASAASRLGRGTLDFLNQTGSIPGRAMGGFISPSNAAALGGFGGSSGLDLARFQNMLDAAIRAMPPVILYPTVDSGEIVERGVNRPRGARAINAHLSDNATHVKAAINKPGS